MDLEELGMEDGAIDEEPIPLKGGRDGAIGSGSHLMPLSDVLRRFVMANGRQLATCFGSVIASYARVPIGYLVPSRDERADDVIYFGTALFVVAPVVGWGHSSTMIAEGVLMMDCSGCRFWIGMRVIRVFIGEMVVWGSEWASLY